MKALQYLRTALLATVVLFSSCSKDDDNNPNDPNSPSNPDPLTTSVQWFKAEGNTKFTNGIGAGGAEATYTVVSASYGEGNDNDPNTNRVQIGFMRSQTNSADLINFFFDGKTYPASGTYQLANIIDTNGGVGGLVAPGKVVVSKGALMSTADGGTINVVNNNGGITITASEIKLYTAIANGYAGSITNINLKKTHTKN